MTSFASASSKKPRFILLGGFLGAGKTTTVGRLARHYRALGLKVGIVTNDQTTDLVDTQSLRAQGFNVEEVTGACFCCNFNELTKSVSALSEADLPDVFLAEPVGSCTDLVATVIRPLAQVYRRPLDIAPYGVLLKPSHGAKILRGDTKTGSFSPKAEYIFRKQLEEADFIVLNRIDELPASEVTEVAGLLDTHFPGRPVVRVSAKTGVGFEALTAFLEQRGGFGQRVLEVDYDVYAEGEAELGWLNCQMVVDSPTAFELDEFLLNLVHRLQTKFNECGAEIAHLKTIGLCEGTYAVANAVSSFTSPELSLPSRSRVTQAHVVINARVALAPETLEELVRSEATGVCLEVPARGRIDSLQCFRPGRPVPTHRFVQPSASSQAGA